MQLGDADQDRSNVEDRRSFSPGAKLGVGGTVAVLAIVLVVTLFSKPDPARQQPLRSTGAAQPAKPQGAARAAAEKDLERVAIGSFNDAQKTWRGVLPRGRYKDAKLVLFWDTTQSGCGAASASSGPFYCGADEKAYIDLGFYRELARRYGAPGEFAQAYVIAHEIGHHVQHLLGTTSKVRALQAKDSSKKSPLSVKLELQADCYAGVWGHSAAQRGLLEAGDVEKGLRAASALGDDHVRRMAHKAISPETFSHGSSEDRVRWFRRGLERGSVDACDTFR
jgi:predicted metalloprotease